MGELIGASLLLALLVFMVLDSRPKAKPLISDIGGQPNSGKT